MNYKKFGLNQECRFISKICQGRIRANYLERMDDSKKNLGGLLLKLVFYVSAQVH